MVVVIEDWVLATVHMWVVKLDKQEARRLIETKITFERVYEAFVKLTEEAQCSGKPVKHTDGGKAGTAIEQTAKEIVDVIYDLDKRADCPRFLLSSRDLCQVPGTIQSNSDVVPLDSRMEELENTVKLLVKGFADMKASPAPVSFATVAGNNPYQGRGVPVGGGHGVGAQRGGVGLGLGAHGGRVGRGGPAQGGARSRVDSLSGRGNQVPRDRLPSESKRTHEEMLADEEQSEEAQFQYPKGRKPRKVNYGKCNVEVAGGEAAPYDVFIGNTNPASTPEIIQEVLEKCAEMLPEENKLSEPLQVLNVTCLTRPHENCDPLRTKCWKVTVANKFREHMLKDESYPYGWSHRRYFPKKNQNSVPPLDPTCSVPKRQLLSAAAGGPPSAQQ